MTKTVTNIFLKLKSILLSSFAFGLISISTNLNELNAQSESLYDLSILSIEGDTINLSAYQGKKILFVNVASKCGYTYQYEGLQKLHETYGDRLTIIGVPSNQFLRQEPGTHAEIIDFCQKNYGVSFLLTEKVEVKGKNKHDIYSWLTSKTKNGKMDSKVKWNFQKYLVGERGELIEMFRPKIKPMDEKITSLL